MFKIGDKKVIKIVILFLLALNIFSLSIQATESIEQREYSSRYSKWLELSEEEKAGTIPPPKYSVKLQKEENQQLLNAKLGASLASSYKISSYNVRDQGDTGSCWAFTANRVFETATKTSFSSESLKLLSEKHLEYSSSATLSETKTQIKNWEGFNRKINDGGRFDYAEAYWTRGKGPILESAMPFTKYNDMNLSDLNVGKVEKRIDNTIYFPTIYKYYVGGNITASNLRYTYDLEDGDDYTVTQVNSIRTKIKEHIMKYGAISASISTMGDSFYDYYNENTASLFVPWIEDYTDHDITIIGWDDNYARTNFNSGWRPTGNGAYIALNSWGKDWGKNGVFYISYEDCFVESYMNGIQGVSNIDYNNIYQYDPLGGTECISRGQDTSAANVFTRSSSAKVEKLTNVSVKVAEGTKCEIYVNPNSSSLSINDMIKCATTEYLSEGFHNIKLSTPVYLTSDKFTVAVRYIDYDNWFSYVYIENEYGVSKSAQGESYIGTFIGNDMRMQDLSNLYISANVCIKAFTTNVVDTTPPSKAILNLNGYTQGTWTNKDVRIGVSATDNIGIKEYKYTKDAGKQWISLVSPISSYTLSAEGSYTTSGKAVDYSGNEGTAANSVVVKIDKSQPTTPTVSSVVNTNSIKVTIESTDILSGIKEYSFYNDGKLIYTGTSKTYEYTGLNPDTNYNLMFSIKDNAGNTTTSTIKLTTNKKADISISSSKYQITSDKYIMKIEPNTDFKTFKNNITANGTINLYDKKNVLKADTDWVGTGMKLKTSNDLIYCLIVTGDISGDGKVDPVDLLAVKRHILSGNKTAWILVGDAFKAGDINGSGKIDVVDLLEVKRMILNKK